MKAIVEVELDDFVREEGYGIDEFKKEKDILIHSQKMGCTSGRIKVIAIEDDFLGVADAMRHALGNNPCIIIDTHDEDPLKRYDHYHFSDKDLVTAFMAAQTINSDKPTEGNEMTTFDKESEGFKYEMKTKRKLTWDVMEKIQKLKEESEG